MKTSLITAAVAILALAITSCVTTTTKTTYPDGRVEEVTVKGIDPQAGALAGTAAGVINRSSK